MVGAEKSFCKVIGEFNHDLALLLASSISVANKIILTSLGVEPGSLGEVTGAVRLCIAYAQPPELTGHRLQ